MIKTTTVEEKYKISTSGLISQIKTWNNISKYANPKLGRTIHRS